MDLLTFVLVLCGATYIITQSSIAVVLRTAFADLCGLCESLVYCPACTGFWVGIALGLCGYWPRSGAAGVLEAGVAACGLGALWSVYGPASVWLKERGDTAAEENDDERS